MPVELPWSAVTAWWVTAWLRGEIALDDVLGEVPLGVSELGELRRSHATSVGIALPVEGDPLGLGGPPDFNLAALEAGEALVTDTGRALVPEDGGRTWRGYDVLPRQLPDLGEADRGLRGAIVESAHRLAELDVARWRPEVADEVLALGRAAHVDAPPGVPPPCVRLAVKAARCLDIVRLAKQDDGAAVSASEIGRRHQALDPLDRAARRALVAACTAECWPPPR